MVSIVSFKISISMSEAREAQLDQQSQKETTQSKINIIDQLAAEITQDDDIQYEETDEECMLSEMEDSDYDADEEEEEMVSAVAHSVATPSPVSDSQDHCQIASMISHFIPAINNASSQDQDHVSPRHDDMGENIMEADDVTKYCSDDNHNLIESQTEEKTESDITVIQTNIKDDEIKPSSHDDIDTGHYVSMVCHQLPLLNVPDHHPPFLTSTACHQYLKVEDYEVCDSVTMVSHFTESFYDSGHCEDFTTEEYTEVTEDVLDEFTQYTEDMTEMEHLDTIHEEVSEMCCDNHEEVSEMCDMTDLTESEMIEEVDDLLIEVNEADIYELSDVCYDNASFLSSANVNIEQSTVVCTVSEDMMMSGSHQDDCCFDLTCPEDEDDTDYCPSMLTHCVPSHELDIFPSAVAHCINSISEQNDFHSMSSHGFSSFYQLPENQKVDYEQLCQEQENLEDAIHETEIEKVSKQPDIIEDLTIEEPKDSEDMQPDEDIYTRENCQEPDSIEEEIEVIDLHEETGESIVEIESDNSFPAQDTILNGLEEFQKEQEEFVPLLSTVAHQVTSPGLYEDFEEPEFISSMQSHMTTICDASESNIIPEEDRQLPLITKDQVCLEEAASDVPDDKEQEVAIHSYKMQLTRIQELQKLVEDELEEFETQRKTKVNIEQETETQIINTVKGIEFTTNIQLNHLLENPEDSFKSSNESLNKIETETESETETETDLTEIEVKPSSHQESYEIFSEEEDSSALIPTEDNPIHASCTLNTDNTVAITSNYEHTSHSCNEDSMQEEQMEEHNLHEVLHDENESGNEEQIEDSDKKQRDLMLQLRQKPRKSVNIETKIREQQLLESFLADKSKDENQSIDSNHDETKLLKPKPSILKPALKTTSVTFNAQTLAEKKQSYRIKFKIKLNETSSRKQTSVLRYLFGCFGGEKLFNSQLK